MQDFSVIGAFLLIRRFDTMPQLVSAVSPCSYGWGVAQLLGCCWVKNANCDLRVSIYCTIIVRGRLCPFRRQRSAWSGSFFLSFFLLASTPWVAGGCFPFFFPLRARAILSEWLTEAKPEFLAARQPRPSELLVCVHGGRREEGSREMNSKKTSPLRPSISA